MDSIEALIGRLPDRADVIRRQFWRDPAFRAVCQDYRDLVEVLAKLEAEQPCDAGRVDEYRQLAAELLAEAIEFLRRR